MIDNWDEIFIKISSTEKDLDDLLNELRRGK